MFLYTWDAKGTTLKTMGKDSSREEGRQVHSTSLPPACSSGGMWRSTQLACHRLATHNSCSWPNPAAGGRAGGG
jgi:hypothetical protein